MKSQISVKELRAIAQQVRSWAESYAHKNDGFTIRDLTGMCAIASGELWRRLHIQGQKATICMYDDFGDSHVFVLYNGYLIDLTATQFGKYPKVIVRKTTNREYFWRVDYRFPTVFCLRRKQKKQGWPTEQMALDKIAKAL